MLPEDPYCEAFRPQLYRRVGDTRTPEGKAFLAQRSPVSHADKIVRPLLIVQGANDRRG
jgi:dipeptidyl aminopeptidase/acylaminoacyl peptidase